MNKEEYIELPREKITFYGETKAERKANELIFDLTLENDRLYQENKDLQQRINKIMEIIELNQYSYGYQIKDEILVFWIVVISKMEVYNLSKKIVW